MSLPFFPEHDCPACERDEPATTPPESWVVGAKPVHQPSGNVCMKYLDPKFIETLKKARAARHESAE